jgi:hypothetical protein
LKILARLDMHEPSAFARHPREGEDQSQTAMKPWIPAFAGMTA